MVGYLASQMAYWKDRRITEHKTELKIGILLRRNGVQPDTEGQFDSHQLNWLQEGSLEEGPLTCTEGPEEY